jgi:hypothetical protein
MASFGKYQPLVSAAEKLFKQAQSDPKIKAQLLADPAKAITEAAGQPLPKGMIVKIAKDDKGRNQVVADMDPKYSGELDNELLEAVSGGKGSSATIGQEIGTSAGEGILRGLIDFGGAENG